VSRKVAPFKMPLKGEHCLLQTTDSIARIGLPSPLTRVVGCAPSRPSQGPRRAGATANPVTSQVGVTHLVHTLGVQVGQARPSVPSTAPQDVNPQHKAGPDEPCDRAAPSERRPRSSSWSEIDEWVQYGRVIKPPDRIAGNASDLPVKSAAAAVSATRQRDTKTESVDLAQLSKNFVLLVEQGSKAIAAWLKPPGNARLDEDTAGEIIAVASTFGRITEYWLTHPRRAIEVQTNLGKSFLDLWVSATKRMLGGQPEPVAGSESSDRRFADPEWSLNPFADVAKRAYLLTSQWARRLIMEANGVDAHTRHKAEFYVRQFTDALSPTNFLFMNPELFRGTICSNTGNLVSGMRMLAEDIEAGRGRPKIRLSDDTTFEVGRNLAITSGKVIYQNELMQLLQYEPTTRAVLKRPILIVPPWINKYYILDLVPEKSFVKWCIDRGLTVFVISWINPDAKLAGKGFDDYMREGPLAALGSIATATGEEKVHTVGYCVGGTLLAATMAYMAAKGDDRVLSATLFATQVDFTHAGDILTFIDEEQVQTLERRMSKTGFLDGDEMATAFNLLRSNDLIWSPIIRNYLKGEPPRSLDFLSWNSDATRIPAACHSFYLRNCYLDNKLAKGEMVLAGEKIDLGNVTTPIYSLAAREDHIAPAKSVFLGAKLFGGPVTFVVAGSGHIAGVINPPYQVKYGHWIDGPFVSSMETWLAKAKERPGSWWPHWLQWIREHDPTEVPPRIPGGSKLELLEDAPGSYVRVKTW
jgi:poly[(R)-3-hydroxyalkanoate] polymerase subunit PhaC